MILLAALALAQASQLPPCPNNAVSCDLDDGFPRAPAFRPTEAEPRRSHSVESPTGAVWDIRLMPRSASSPNRRAWVRIDYSRDRTVPERRAQGVLELACMERRYHWITLVRWDADDSLVGGIGGPPVPHDIASDPMVARVWRLACPRQR